MCVAHPRKWLRFLLACTVLADLDGQNLRFRERRSSFESARLVCVCSYNILISQFLLRYIGVNCLISRTLLVRSGVECGGVRDVAEQSEPETSTIVGRDLLRFT